MERKLNAASASTPDNVFFFSGLHQLVSGRHPVRAKANQILSLVLKRAVRRWSLKHGRVHGAVADLVFDAIPPNCRGDLSRWGEARTRVIEKKSYAPFHQFADALDLLSREVDREFSGASGLLTQDMSVFRLSETRWLEPVLTQIAVTAEIVSKILVADGRTGSVHLLSSGTLFDRIAEEIAAHRGYAVHSISFLGKLLADKVEALEERGRLRQSFGLIVKDWLARAGLGNPGVEVQKSKVVFIAYKDRTLRRLLMMLDSLKANFPDAKDIVLLAVTRGSDAAAQRTIDEIESKGVRVVYAAEVLGVEASQNLVQITAENQEAVSVAFFSRLPPFEFEGIDLAPYCVPLLKEVLLEGSAAAALYAESAHRCFELLNPSVIVNFEEWDFNRAMSIVAQKKGVPVITHQLLSPAGWLGLVRRLSDVMAVSGDFLKSGYEKTAIWKKENILVVGDPYADQVSRLDRKKARERLVHSYKLDPNLPVVGGLLTFTDGVLNPSHFQAFHQVLARLSQSELNLVLRPHPQISPAQARAEFLSYGMGSPVLGTEVDLLEYAAGCDVIVAMPTSALTQPFLALTPVVGVLPKSLRGNYDKVYEWESKAGVEVLDLETLSAERLLKAIENLLNDKNYRESKTKIARSSVEAHVGPIDGKSAARMSYLVASLARRERPEDLFSAFQSVSKDSFTTLPPVRS